ncbi:hypothetical protein [Nocardioides pyridinolyticus]
MSRVLLVAVSLAAAISLAGCGSDSSTPDSAPAPADEPTRTHAPQARPSATSAPAPSTTPTTPTTSPSRSAKRHKVGELAPLPRAAAADAHLLDADRLPRFDGHTWKLSSTDHPGAVGACQKTELESIGAVEAVSRRFTADDGLAAVQVVARFPDAKTAWRAHQVLVAWREDCEERVRDSTVGPLRPVTVTAGTADSYLGSFRARSAGLGILRSGAFLTLVEVAAGREAYPTKWDPARVAVRRIARTF